MISIPKTASMSTRASVAPLLHAEHALASNRRQPASPLQITEGAWGKPSGSRRLQAV